MSVPEIKWVQDKEDATKRRASVSDAELFIQHCTDHHKEGGPYWFWHVWLDDRASFCGEEREEKYALRKCESLAELIWKAAQYDAAQKHEGSK